MDKWVNGFRLKPYYGPMPPKPFHQVGADAVIGSSKQVRDNQAEPVLPDINLSTSTSGKQADDKQVVSKHDQAENRDTDLVFLIN